MKELYRTTVSITGGRDGGANSSDGHLAVRLALPKEIGGNGGASNPEQLFAAGFGGCFTSSVKFSAQQMKLNAGDVTTDATVTLGAHEDGRFGLRALLDVTVPGLSGADLDAVIAEAKRICAYTNATRGNVEVTYRINGN
jgi:lipoyl-dependent peroxiredoxin